ncbi:MAG TPA: 4Fe-4S binding protein [Candidatus Obscuribacterales bacterium]
MLQHVTDPEMCICCSACELACPQQAIVCIVGRYCIDADLCKGCGKCIEECPTGAADCYVEVARYFSQDEQSEWTQLPPR